MTLTNKEFATLKAKLTRAVNSKNPNKVIKTCDDAIAIFERKGYPDNWHKWQRAKEDAVWNKLMSVFRA